MSTDREPFVPDHPCPKGGQHEFKGMAPDQGKDYYRKVCTKCFEAYQVTRHDYMSQQRFVQGELF
jgi:hypothetical protein